jgi:hypothetical protein
MALLVAGGCTRPDAVPSRDSTTSDTTLTSTDSLPDERPDSVTSTPPDSAVMTLALLPAPTARPLNGAAADMAERAVFVPRIQRWFLARQLDSALVLDIGRIDGGVANRDSFVEMVRATSPITIGLTVTLHAPDGRLAATVRDVRTIGRRIVADLDVAAPLSTDSVFPTEWRGAQAPAPVTSAVSSACTDRDAPAVVATLARYTSSPTHTVSSVRGCFGAFRAIVVIRPREITTETVDRVLLVRPTGETRSGKLRDLSYPLHDVLSAWDVTGDGRDDLIVRSYRPAMETWAALRMTDSTTFTRFASGFTIEKR